MPDVEGKKAGEHYGVRLLLHVAGGVRFTLVVSASMHDSARNNKSCMSPPYHNAQFEAGSNVALFVITNGTRSERITAVPKSNTTMPLTRCKYNYTRPVR